MALFRIEYRPRLEAIAGKFQDKPLIGFVSTLLQDYVPLIDEYYYCELSNFPDPYQRLCARLTWIIVRRYGIEESCTSVFTSSSPRLSSSSFGLPVVERMYGICTG